MASSSRRLTSGRGAAEGAAYGLGSLPHRHAWLKTGDNHKAMTRSNTPPRTAIRWRNGSSAACMPKATASRRTISRPSNISAASPTAMPTTIPTRRRRASSPTPSSRSANIISTAFRKRAVKRDPERAREMFDYAASYFRDPRRAILSGAALSRRHRRAARSAHGGALVRALGAEGPVPGAGHARRHAVHRRPRAAPGRARADVARRSPRTVRRKPTTRAWITGSTTAPSARRPRTSARWRWSISSAGWRRGGSRASHYRMPSRRTCARALSRTLIRFSETARALRRSARYPDRHRPARGRTACPSRARGGRCRRRPAGRPPAATAAGGRCGCRRSCAKAPA